MPEAMRSELELVDEEIRDLRQENKELEDLVTHLGKRASDPTPFTAHRIPLPKGQISLEETLREALTPKRKKRNNKVGHQDLLF
jgi:hypothetical protein